MAHGGGIHTVCEFPERFAVFAENALKKRRLAPCNIAYCIYSVVTELSRCWASDKKKVAARKRPRNHLKVLFADNRYCVGLFIIRAELCKNLIEADAYADGYSELIFNALPYLLGNILAAPAAARYVEPALIKTERLNIVSVILINLPAKPWKAKVKRIIRRNDNKLRAFLPCLPERLTDRKPVLWSKLVLRENYTVAALCTAAHRHRLIPHLRTIKGFHRGVKLITVNVKYCSFHIITFSNICLFLL